MASGGKKRRALSRVPRQLRDMQLAVGAFVTTFTELEMYAHWFLISLRRNDAAAKRAAAEDFARRVKALIRVSETCAPKSFRRGWIGIWKKALVLAKHRNSICHNPPVASVYMSGAGNLKVARLSLHLFKKELKLPGGELPHYTTPQIRAYERQARRLVTRVVKSMGEWNKARVLGVAKKPTLSLR